jgi:hypothetical protein
VLVPLVPFTDLSVVDKNQKTVFHIAAAISKDVLLRSLLDEHSKAKGNVVPWSVLHVFHGGSSNDRVPLSVGSVKRLIEFGADVDRMWPGSEAKDNFKWVGHPLHYEVSQGVATLIVKKMSPETLLNAVTTMKYQRSTWGEPQLFHSMSSFNSRRAWMARELRWKQWRILLFLQRHGPPHLRRLLAVDDIMYEVFDVMFPKTILPSSNDSAPGTPRADSDELF